MSKQQTAVDWLAHEINRRGPKENNPPQWLHELYDQAKAMEKEQIIDAYDTTSIDELGEFLNGKQYYNETYESKESDDHIGDANKMVTAVQKLIDKDIFNQAILAMEEMYGSGCDAEIDAYFRGAKWMRQELNKQI